MPLPLIGAGLGGSLGIGVAGTLLQSFGGGMGGCCDGIFGGNPFQGPGERNGLFGGGLAGAVLGGLGGGFGGALLGGATGGLLGGLLGRLFDRNRGHHHQHGGQCGGQFQNFPNPGSGWGGQANGCYGPPPSYGGNPWGGAGAYQQGFQDGFQAAQGRNQYQQGFQDGFRAGSGDQFGGQWPPRNCWQPPQIDPSCGKGSQWGQLSQEGGEGKPIGYTTRGGWNVSVNGDRVTITDPSGQHKIEHWGDPHENVNGKHIKDWQTKDRTMILPDGTKVSMNADSPNGLVKHVSIYDGDRNVQIDNLKNKIESNSFNPWETRSREAYQADGETSLVRLGRDGSMNISNIYTQDSNLGFRDTFKDLGTWPGTRPPFTTNNTPQWLFPRLAY